MKEELSVREAGRKGGKKVREKYGSEFYQAIGRKGGETTRARRGTKHYQEIGAKGAAAREANKTKADAKHG